MARKNQIGKIINLEEADRALKAIGVLESQLEQIDAEADRRINLIKEEAEIKGKPVRDQIAGLTASIGVYAENHRDELFRDKKTINLSFGVFGFRKSVSISLHKNTLDLLKKLKLTHFIRTKETPDKEAMKKMTAKELAGVKAARETKDTFFCKTKKGKVNTNLLQTQAKSA